MKHTSVVALSLLYSRRSIRLHVTGGNLFGLTGLDASAGRFGDSQPGYAIFTVENETIYNYQ